MSLENSVHLNLLGYGGAWNATKRIAEAIELEGYGAKAINFVNPGSQVTTSTKVIFKFDLEIGKMSGAPTTISMLRGFSSKQWISQLDAENIKADIWNLHWLPGHIDVEFLEFFQYKNVVWTIHDMNPFTGVCHYSSSCREYQKKCSSCPQVVRILHPLVRGLLRNKIHAIRQFRNLKIVSPSKWLFNAFKESSLGKEIEIRHIPNPVPQINLAESGVRGIPTVTILGSNYSESKNSRLGARAIQRFTEEFPKFRFKLQVIGLPFPEISHRQECLPIGSSELDTYHFLEQSDIFIYTSILDNLPSLVLEAQSTGNVIIAFDKGGISECFIPKVSGLLVQESEAEILSALSFLLTDISVMNEMSRQGIEFVKRNFSSQIVANKYISLYKEMY
jgi:glycosyltransferase involved in cell wall biosynthesis